MRRFVIALTWVLLCLATSASARSALWNFSTASVDAPDTLEIRLFLVQFQQDASSSSGITGNGTFGSDTGSYALEGPKLRKDPVAHARRVLAQAQDYWRRASGGRLLIQPVVFDTVLRLGQTMNYFTLPARSGSETRLAYLNRTEIHLLDFVDTAVRLAATHTGPTAPFSTATVSDHHKVVHACMHAGINRSTDGGSKGSSYANTERDFLDFYVGAGDFALLSQDTLTRLRRDTLGIALPSGDTVKNLLLLPEAMSQDGLNWGVAGLVNQEIGNALGLPSTGESGTRNPSPSVLGYWDLMDAGASAGQGFLPTLPMAWQRLYLGWATPVILKAGSTAMTREIPAVRPARYDSLTGKWLPGADSVFIIQLDGGEYLLIENRQRADAGVSRVIQLTPGAVDSLTSIAVSPDSVGVLFNDSLCVSGKCAANPKQPKGYVTSADADAGLPGSGLLVWKVNEWLLQQYLASLAVNPWLGDSLADHYRGLTLLQASGKTTLGQRLQSSTGSVVLDYGSGSDVLPHVFRKISNSRESSRDTVTVVPSVGYVSTQTSTGARTLITLSSAWPADAAVHAERGELSLTGDSVVNAGCASLPLSVSWGTLHAAQDSLYPVKLPSGLGAHSFLPGPSVFPHSSWVIDSTGHVQLIDSAGVQVADSICQGRGDTGTVTEKSSWADSVSALFATAASANATRSVHVQNLTGLLEAPLGTASLGDTLAVITAHHLVLAWPSGRVIDTATFAMAGATAPVGISGSGFYAVDSAKRLWRVTTARADSLLRLPLRGIPQSLCRSDSAGALRLYAVDDSAIIAAVQPASASARALAPAFGVQAGEHFTLAASDFDRDGVNDVAVLGSRGSMAIRSGADGSLFSGWPRIFARGGSSVLGDSGLPAVADLDGSGYPQILFTGTNRLWLVDKNGVTPSGWPVHVTGNEVVNGATAGHAFPAGVFGTSPLVVSLGDTTRKQVLVGSPDGEIFAFNADGSAVDDSLVIPVAGVGNALGYAVSSWPIAAGSRVADTSHSPWLHVYAAGNGRLSTLSAVQGLDLFRVGMAKVWWGLPSGTASREAFLDVSGVAVSAGGAEVTGFHFYPHPVRGGKATVRYDLGENASSVRLEIIDQTSHVVLSRSDLPTVSGRQAFSLSDLHLGTGVYLARLTVKFPETSRSVNFRLAVVK